MEPTGQENNLEDAFGVIEEHTSLDQEEIVDHENMDDYGEDF